MFVQVLVVVPLGLFATNKDFRRIESLGILEDNLRDQSYVGCLICRIELHRKILGVLLIKNPLFFSDITK
jgi:hypothetical protein